MEKKQQKIENILITREGYNEVQARIAASEALKLSSELKDLFEGWLDDAKNTQDFVIGDISLMVLKKNRNMNYLGALLTIDWLIKEPHAAKPIIDNLLS